MAYVAPIHRPSSVRHALKLKLLSDEVECLVVAKANRLEIWILASESLVMVHSKAIYGQVSMLQKIRPSNSTRDHLFVGTQNFQYFTACWNVETKQLDTVQTFVDVSEKHMRDSQSLDRCLVDPTGQHMVMELFEGVLNLVKVIKPRKGFSQYLDEPDQVRISELNVRASTFLYTESRCPKLALLYEESYKNRSLRLVTYKITDEKGHYSQFDAKKDRENELDEIDPGATLLIPVPKGEAEQKRYIYRNLTSAKAQLGGVIVVGETTMLYLDDTAKAKVEYALDEASSFVAWERYDGTRYLLADEFGWLHLLTILVDGAVVTGMDVTKIGEISKASTMVFLGNDMLYIGSHEGDSQMARLDLMGLSLDILQTLPNIAPILDFAVMDLGNRNGETQSNDYSTGQARLVTGSGCYKTGTLRSVRSGVGLEDIGLLGEMENIRALFSLDTQNHKVADTLVLSFLTETRIFKFDDQGEVEEVEEFLGMSIAEQTLLAANVSETRIIQVTASKVAIFDTGCGRMLSSWIAPKGEIITAASANQSCILLSIGGKCLLTLNVHNALSEVARQNLGENDQVACVFVPHEHNIGLVGFWQKGSISILNLSTLEVLQGETLRTPDSAAVPRSIVMTQILPNTISGPTLLVAMSDGIVVTFTVDKESYALSGKKSVMLGVQHANLQVIPRDQDLCNVFATCEHSSLIYGSEGKIVYSAVTAEDATCICPFDSEAYPDAVVIATASDVKISQIDTQRRTHVRTLPIGETVRRITYSANERVFGLGCIKRDLIKGEEFVISSFRLVDEVAFRELGKPFVFDTVDGVEIIECCIRAMLPNTYGEPMERFIVGTSYLREDSKGKAKAKYNGKIRVMGVNKDRSPYEILSHGLKGACRCLGVVDGKIFAGLVKTVVMYKYTESSTSSASLESLAVYRCSTCPIDLDVTDNIVVVGDLMKSMSLVEYIPGKDGEQGELVEVARHFQASFATAVSHIEGDSYLESDSDGNLIVLRRNVTGVTLEDRQRLEVTSEINLGEMVNRIRKIDVETSSNATVVPKAFLCTTEGSIYLFGTIAQSAQDLLMRLQSRMAELVMSLGNMPFNKYRAYKAEMRETEEPFRFVDGELIERFLDISESRQEDICKGLGPTVEDVRNMVEELKRLH